MNQDEITLGSLNYYGMFKELLRNWWLIVLSVLSCFLLVVGIGKWIYVPQYSASATLAVTAQSNQNSYSSLTLANQMATVIKEVFESDTLLDLVQQDIGDSVQGEVSCSLISETNLLVLTVTSDAPQDAYQYLNAALKHYNEVSDYVFSNANLQVLQEPSIPTSPSNAPLFWSYRYYIALAGGVCMAGILILLYIFRHTLKTSNNASKLLDGTIRGVIPFEKKKGSKAIIKSKTALLISSSTVSMNFAEANRRMASRVQSHLDKHHKKVLLNVSVGENEGKSTIVANLALALTEKHKKVLLIDGDFRKPSLYKVFDKEILDFNPFEELLKKKVTLEKALVQNERYGFWELFIYHPLKDISQLINSEVLTEILEEVKAHFDYIIIDCSPVSVSTDAEIWMEAVDSCLITARQDWADIRSINDTVDLIWQSNCDFAGFVLNSFEEEKIKHDVYGYAKYQSSMTKQGRRREHG